MKFCEKCDNMYYMKVNEQSKLIYVCKNCGNENEEEIKTENMKVYKYSNETKQKNIQINQYTKYDPTLPHMTNIKCPNPECKCNKQVDIIQDVVYLRYDDENMKYIYLCCHCDFNWTP